jgi:hypothetical protein
MRGDRDVLDASPIVGEEHQDEHEAIGHGLDHEEIGRHNLAQVIPQAVRQVCEGRWRGRPMYFATVVSQTSMPSFRSSP